MYLYINIYIYIYVIYVYIYIYIYTFLYQNMHTCKAARGKIAPTAVDEFMIAIDIYTYLTSTLIFITLLSRK